MSEPTRVNILTPAYGYLLLFQVYPGSVKQTDSIFLMRISREKKCAQNDDWASCQVPTRICHGNFFLDVFVEMSLFVFDHQDLTATDDA